MDPQDMPGLHACDPHEWRAGSRFGGRDRDIGPEKRGTEQNCGKETRQSIHCRIGGCRSCRAVGMTGWSRTSGELAHRKRGCVRACGRCTFSYARRAPAVVGVRRAGARVSLTRVDRLLSWSSKLPRGLTRRTRSGLAHRDSTCLKVERRAVPDPIGPSTCAAGVTDGESLADGIISRRRSTGTEP